MMLSGKKIIVTGAASGIGAETAKTIKSQGASVIGLDINEPKDNVDDYFRIDFRDPSSIETVAAVIPGGIDGLCNIAGLPPTKDRVDVIKVNFLGCGTSPNLLSTSSMTVLPLSTWRLWPVWIGLKTPIK